MLFHEASSLKFKIIFYYEPWNACLKPVPTLTIAWTKVIPWQNVEDVQVKCFSQF